MESLDARIARYNTELTKELSNFSFEDSICRIAERGIEKVRYNKDNKPIVFDDKFDYFGYHGLVSISHDKIAAGGKKVKYNNNARIELIIYTKHRSFADCVFNKLAKFPEITILDTDFESYKILRNETTKNDYNISHYIFVVNYQVQYQTTSCVSYACD